MSGPASRLPQPRRRPESLGIEKGFRKNLAREAYQMREEAGDEGDVIINIDRKKKRMARGGDTCAPNARTGNIDMRGDKGMVRHIKNNLGRR